jgi:hypothetical protein
VERYFIENGIKWDRGDEIFPERAGKRNMLNMP